MLYTSKWCKNFKHIDNLFRKLNSKKHHHFWHFLMEKLACEVQLPNFLQSWKNDFDEFECLYFTTRGKFQMSWNFTCWKFQYLTTRWIFWNFYHVLSIHHIIRSYKWLHVSKIVFFQKFGSCTRNGSFGAFLENT